MRLQGGGWGGGWARSRAQGVLTVRRCAAQPEPACLHPPRAGPGGGLPASGASDQQLQRAGQGRDVGSREPTRSSRDLRHVHMAQVGARRLEEGQPWRVVARSCICWQCWASSSSSYTRHAIFQVRGRSFHRLRGSGLMHRTLTWLLSCSDPGPVQHYGRWARPAAGRQQDLGFSD